jgi:hypothetical protein
MANQQRQRSIPKHTAVAEHWTVRSSAANDDVVRTRAYELFEARGAQDGYDVDDWLQAERELSRAADAQD